MPPSLFSDLDLIEPLQRAVKESGYTEPTPIQRAAIPPLLEGRDLLGCAQTGTGKTAAFALPILNRLVKNPKRAESRSTRVLVLTPTRELAIQIEDSFKTYGKYLRMKYAVVYGGVGQGPQVKAMNQGIDVLVATPGRLLDLINQRHLSLRNLEVFVLDEADRMLDMGFIHDIKKIIAMLPVKRHNLFFSATMPADIERLASTMLVQPIRVEVTPVSSTAELISQSVMFVERNRKKDLLRHVLQDRAFQRVIVFTRTKRGANQVSEVLDKNGIVSEAIHGNKSQGARQRALENFRSGRTRVLVATDIAARGIDIDGITHVINFEVPNVAESYVHRIGRTARAGATGKAISFCDAEERAFIKDIEKLIGQSVPVDLDQPFHSENVANSRPMSKGKAKAAIERTQNRGGSGRGGRNGERKNGFKGPRTNSTGGEHKAKAPHAAHPSAARPVPSANHGGAKPTIVPKPHSSHRR
jgi:ATP-dependent RNA helicase RhlE